MYIKSIVIDGFKSYAKRTEVPDFDPAFNAITGLNGSGKSNILDSICFLLGITNLSQVRATNLQELVYKSGQAGITKASVSIKFDNRDKSTSPQGYSDFDELTITRQIVIGGKNKYLINGISATNTRVQDLFRSVQLNVNNPHFLIMQGRITKVLNMKPPEILSLLEEAASTKHYELKREDTLKTIEKKDVKLHEIDKILKEDINPTLVKLKQERSSYLEYQKIVRDLEYLNKFIVAYDYTIKKAIVDNSDGELKKMIAQQFQEEETIVKCDKEKLDLEQKINELSTERDVVHHVKLDDIQNHYSELQKEEVILKNGIKRAEENLKEAQKSLRVLEKQSTEDLENQENVKNQISKIQNQFDKLRVAVEQSKAQVDAAQDRLQKVNCGFFVSESGDATGSLADLLASAEKEESGLEIQLNVNKMRISHLTKSATEMEQKLRGMIKNESAAQQEIKHKELSSKIVTLKNQIEQMGYSQETWSRLQNEQLLSRNEEQKSINFLEHWFRENNLFNFVYKKPHPNFNAKKIYGLVIKLVKLEQKECALALEIAAGRQLFNVVVDEAATVTQLFDGNCLHKRVTMLPLNNLNARTIPTNKIKQAQDIVGYNNVWYPMDIIRFDQKFAPAMQCVFGNFLIARDMDMAKVIAFDPKIKVRCVTLDGEIFDPEGTLAGGSQLKNNDYFIKAQELVNLENSVENWSSKNMDIEKQLMELNSVRDRCVLIQKDLRSREIELRQLERMMGEDDYLEVQKNLTDTRVELDNVVAQNNETIKLHKVARGKANVARDNMANAASVQEQAQKTAQQNLKAAQDGLEKSETAFKDVEFRYESLTLELNSGEQDRQDAQANILSNQVLVETRVNELQCQSKNMLAHNATMNECKFQLDEQKKVVKEIEAKIVQSRERVKEILKTKDKAGLKLTEVNHRISCHKRDSEDAEKKLAKLMSKYTWIQEESKHFNQPGSIYDFANKDWKEAEQNIAKLEEQKRKLGSKVNLRGMNMLGQTEERYNDLMTKYKQVLQDKKVLQSVIADLDKLKDEVIKKAHKQVDQDFNKIFSTLLPGSEARLNPPEGKQLSDGLEFKIAFGNVWKDSLNELSGGQRSLVALSLILALLRFKPAPLYILDEVDAALDISHTSNIGTLIKEHFSDSQFIIVSLKDGMFNNANVLFKTKFVDGVSTVTRHVNTARRPMTERNI